MDKINVLVLTDIGEKCLRQIAGVSPRVNVIDASKIWSAPDPLSEARRSVDSDEELNAMLAQAEIIYAFRLPQDVIARAPGLKWIQTMSAGVDRLLTPEIINSLVILTSASGIHGSPVGEVVMGMILLFAKRALFCLERKRLKRWERFTPDLLRYQTVGVLGLGSIGREIARMCKAFGMRVIATRRSVREETRGRYVDRVVPRERLSELLSASDYVVNVLPSTPGTNKMIGEKELRSMKRSAYFINVGRGKTVDEEALIRALEEGWIAGAGLDTFAVEPLPPDSRLWELPNVFISPHIAGVMKNYVELTTEVFCDNLERYISGKRLRNVVNKKRGY